MKSGALEKFYLFISLLWISLCVPCCWLVVKCDLSIITFFGVVYHYCLLSLQLYSYLIMEIQNFDTRLSFPGGNNFSWFFWSKLLCLPIHITFSSRTDFIHMYHVCMYWWFGIPKSNSLSICSWRIICRFCARIFHHRIDNIMSTY